MNVAKIGACAGMVIGLSIVSAQNTPTSSPIPSQPTPQPKHEDQQPATIKTASDLLLALETTDKNIRALISTIRYAKTFTIAGDRQVRSGKLYYVAPDPANAEDQAGRRFAIYFDKKLVGQRQENDLKVYIFDGQWLVEKDPVGKFIKKRQVVPPGQTFDPLRIGEGPLPIPIGQKREEILRRFTATLVPAEEGLDKASLIRFVNHGAGTYQLKLVPRPHTAQADQFDEIRLWYARDKLLPVLSRTINPEGESIVQLRTINAVSPDEINPAVFDTTIPKGWDSDTEAYRAPIVKGR